MPVTGKFIVIYGANNLGKTTQAKLLAENLRKHKIASKVKYIKYAIYDLSPTGPKINAALREGLKIDELKLQTLYAQNRRDFEPTLKKTLKTGTWVVAEDYKGTGIAWGVAGGLDISKLEEINKDLLGEDLAILLDGERFLKAKENGHRYEDSGTWERSRQVHLDLAIRYGWVVVNSNKSEKQVAHDIWYTTLKWIKFSK